ncbi:hypothetical protein B6U74_02735 [Candidatus Bathyarchaeota archaeon ex4484_205]|nr:MAG: hypothetical protein B6U74_02735 [Candidatus Bathyarchaeota archaeon ex4484_205]RLG67120.1 MAG: hypothetical protein DRN93_05085 [archaeon]
MMDGLLYSFIRAFIVLFMIIDPIGNIPFLITITEGLEKEERKRAFNLAIIVAAALLAFFTLTGRSILQIFGIKLDSFMIGGGILLLLLSMKILLGGSLEKEVKRDESVGAVPIACPLLVGPGAITATILLLETEGILVTVLAAGANFAIIFLTMRNIDRVYRILGRTGTEVIAKVMALLLAAIAVEFISDGIKAWISRL